MMERKNYAHIFLVMNIVGLMFSSTEEGYSFLLLYVAINVCALVCYIMKDRKYTHVFIWISMLGLLLASVSYRNPFLLFYGGNSICALLCYILELSSFKENSQK